MIGNSTKGQAWAGAVRSTLYASTPTSKPKWKLSFRDYVEKKDNVFQIKADFALAFRLFDNRELAKRINISSISDLSTFDNFYITSGSKGAIKQVASLLDQEFESYWDDDVLQLKKTTVSIFKKSIFALRFNKFIRIKSPTKKLKYAKYILKSPSTPPRYELLILHQVAELYLRKGMAVHLAEPIFRKLKEQYEIINQNEFLPDSVFNIGVCLFAKEQWEESISFLENHINLGIESPGILELMDRSRKSLTTKNS